MNFFRVGALALACLALVVAPIAVPAGQYAVIHKEQFTTFLTTSLCTGGRGFYAYTIRNTTQEFEFSSCYTVDSDAERVNLTLDGDVLGFPFEIIDFDIAKMAKSMGTT